VGLLIDSTALIHADRARWTPSALIAGLLDRFGDAELAMSAMSAGELFHGCWRAESAQRRARNDAHFGRLDAPLTARGKRLPTSDLLIASTAMAREDEIVTGNLRHFDSIPRLVVHRYP
jgi:predicted nucleic acid-binding protein